MLDLYRKLPIWLAVSLAAIGALVASSGLTGAAVLVLGKLLGPEGGPGAGVLIIMAIPNIAIPSLIAAFSFLVNQHHRASWKTPTLAFFIAAIATWRFLRLGVGDIGFAPAVLGTGALACGITCFILRQRGESQR